MAQAWGDACLKLEAQEASFFDGPEGFREWLEANHESQAETAEPVH